MAQALPPPSPPSSWRNAVRALWLLTALVVVLALAAIVGLKFLDTQAGRDFAVRQLPLYAPASGLTVRAGRIDGSIFGRATIHDLEIGDPRGVFARAHQVSLDWRPFDLVRNRLTIAALASPEVEVLRRPALRPSADPRILPDIDIAVARVALPRIVLDAPVIGSRRVVSMSGGATSVAGRARLDLDAGGGGGDRVRVHLDAEPDRDRFDLAATVDAPAGGVVAGLLGLRAPLAARVAGDGAWHDWRGAATASLGGAPLADLRLSAAKGLYTLAGRIVPQGLLGGAAARLTAGGVELAASATLDGRRAAARIAANTRAVTASAGGTVDFAAESLAGWQLEARLLEPAALAARLTGRDVRLRARIAGNFRAPLVDYVATASALAYGRTAAATVRVVGIIAGGARPLVIPVTATAARVTGLGADLDALLTDVRVTGPLTLHGSSLASNALTLRSDRLSGRAVASADLAGGGFNVALTGSLSRYLVPGVGVADIVANLRAVPDGVGARLAGTVGVAVTRLDSSFFTTLTEGLPKITADIVLTPDNVLAFSRAKLLSPGLSLTVSGTRAPDQSVRLAGSGVSRRYGPLDLRLAGPITTPVVDLTLARPGLGVGLARVVAHLAPTGGDWSFDARGATPYGNATARGLIRAGTSRASIDLAAVTLAGLTAHGSVAPTASGPFAGRLTIGGAGIAGTVALSAAAAVQRADVALDAVDARLPLDPAVVLGKASLRAVVLLPDAGPSITGRFDLAEGRRQDIVLTRASGTIDYHAGRGTAKLDVAGIGHAPFSIAAQASLAGDRIDIAGDGMFDRRRIGLDHPAVLTRSGADWLLAPVLVTTPDGRAEVSGRFGETLALKARLDNLGLSLLTLVNPAFDFGGRVTGILDVTLPPRALPSGTAALRVSGLSRAGLAAASLPIDVAINAALAPGGGSARAVIVRGGAVEGRLQAQLGAVAGDAQAPVLKRLLATPLFAQARYIGPAQALWPLAGIAALDVRGPVTIAADVGGRLGEPTLTGTIRSDGARVENVTLGTVVEKARLDGRFTASRLELASFSGEVGKGGSISGSGSVGLAADQGFPLDLTLKLSHADALKRDDLAATVTGDLRIVSGRDGGRISGKLVADKARFRIGRAAAVEVPVLTVREINAELVRRSIAPAERPARWGLDIAVDAGNRVVVEGMGLQSDWRGDLTIGGTTLAPAISGRVRLIRGDYDFAGKRFQLTRGDLRFQGRYPPDPIIDIAAENTSASFTATLTITGTALRPEIAFGSVPALPQDEVLSRVLFGSGIATLSAPEALQLAGALASLRGGKGDGLNPINFVRKRLGIDRLRVLPADTVSGRRTAIAAGQYIGRRLYVELASDAQGYTATNIEVSLTRSLSILSQVATIGGTSVNLRLKKDY